ncbi:MAG: hypothetical protein K2I89_07650 [Muribaculaceae bacterium]|nr:hypothetical protein [Muribaculaceae bacterium]
MKRAMLMLMAVLMFSVSAWCQNAASIGRAVTQVDDFAYSKKMLTADGFVLNQKQTTTTCLVYEWPKAKYADEAMIVKIYKMPNSQKVEKCVILIGQKYLSHFGSQLREYGYSRTNPNGLSIEPFQELYEDEKFAMGARINKRGWYEATFFRWGRNVNVDD